LVVVVGLFLEFGFLGVCGGFVFCVGLWFWVYLIVVVVVNKFFSTYCDLYLSGKSGLKEFSNNLKNVGLLRLWTKLGEKSK
jgi:hypothetical protein